MTLNLTGETNEITHRQGVMLIRELSFDFKCHMVQQVLFWQMSLLVS